MRIGVTVEADGGSEDLLVDCDDSTTVEELERSLHVHLGRHVRLPGARRDPACRTVVNGARFGGVGRRRAQRRARWQLHVVSGPDSGVVWDLDQGEHVVGRSGGICWDDPVMSRRHVAVRVGSVVEVTDLGSAHGTRLEGNRCARGAWVTWAIGATLELGTSVAILRERPPANGVWEAADPGWRRLLRPPRLPAQRHAEVIEFPQRPGPPEKRALPAVALGVPLVVGIGIALALRRPEYLLFAAASPLMVLANHVGGRFGGARRHLRATAAYSVELEKAERRVEVAVRAEQGELRDDLPDAAATLLIALLPGRRLWERRPNDSDFLRLRVGSADQPSRLQVSGGESTVRDARLVPQSVDLASAPVVGVVGDRTDVDGVLRWMLAQLAAHHSPGDLSLAFLGLDSPEDWSWLRWLPHLRSATGGSEIAVGTDSAAIRERVAELRHLIRHRRERAALEPAAVVVVVRGCAEVARVVDLRDIVDEGPRVGVHVLCTASVDSELPDQTQLVLSTRSRKTAYGSLIGQEQQVDPLLLERVSSRWAERFARALAPYQDASNDGRSAVPERAYLLQRQPRPSDISAAWAENPRHTSVVLGAAEQGPLALDLRRDGPHALIAGMTGSGKTELLQTLILGLALGSHPEWLNFVLIDYKGDSAFQECGRLPHAVGKVTDLDPTLVQRALTSLRAELDRRKAVLADALVGDVDAYYEVWLREPHRPRLPRLVLVIDEFAELARELPDFIDGLVSVAQSGRSLGVHLILATQRPSGVLSPAIRANTNVRIALRVADPADSVDVLGIPDASLIPAGRPGRGYLRLGAHPAAEFQAARAAGSEGADEPGSRREPVISSLSWTAAHEAATPRVADGSACDVAVVVDAVRAAAEGAAKPRRPWLDPLPTQLLWSQRDPRSTAAALRLPFGLTDLPALQRQEIACFDLERDGHLYVIGASRSGRSQTLLVLAAAIAELTDPAAIHVYGLDGGAGDLRALTSMPNCGAVVARHETERVGRLFARLIEELDRRQASPAGAEDPPRPRLVLMLDRWEGFASTFMDVTGHLDAVMRLLREGAGVGIHLVITGDRNLLTNTRVSAMTEAKYVLRMSDKGDYALAGLNAKQVGELPPGRCFGPGMQETQVFRLDVEPKPRPAEDGPRPFRLDPLPTAVEVAEALALLPSSASRPAPIVAVGGDEMIAFAPDLSNSTCFAVIGPARSGRSSVLIGAVESATRTGAEVVIVSPRRGSLHQVERRPGVLAAGATVADVQAALTRGSGRPLVLAIDDVDQLDPSAEDILLAIARGQVHGVFLMVAGTAEGIGYGLRGWRAELRKASQGLLLSPRGVGDGELIGARLSRDLVGGPIRPGRGFLVDRDGVLIPVATLTPR